MQVPRQFSNPNSILSYAQLSINFLFASSDYFTSLIMCTTQQNNFIATYVCTTNEAKSAGCASVHISMHLLTTQVVLGNITILLRKDDIMCHDN